MSKKLYEESNIESIADAIREKNGTENTYKVSQMPAAVRAIKTQPVLQEKTAIENGDVVADTGYDGLSKVKVQVPQSADPVLETLNVSSNGTYTPGTGVDGFDEVNVNVPTGSSGLPSEYQEVEYLAVDGKGVHVIMDYELQNEDTLKIHLVHSSYNANNASWAITTSYGTGSGVRFSGKYVNDSDISLFGGSTGKIYEVSRPDVVASNDQSAGITGGFSQSEPLVFCFLVSGSLARKFVIGAYSSSGAQWPAAGTKIYGPVSIRRANGQYCVFAIPCYRKSDNVCGYYDLCSKAFYAQTGGTFTPGPNVTNNYDFQNVSILKPRIINYVGTFEPYKGTDGYSRIIVPQEIIEQGDTALLFHFDDDFYNIGTTESETVNTTGLEISSEQSKFGGKSLKCGTTQTADNIALTDFDFGDKDFTIDFWFYPVTNGNILTGLICFTLRSLSILSSSTIIEVGITSSTSSWTIDERYSQAVSAQTWHHLALVRDGANIYTFFNGHKIGTANFNTNMITPTTTLTLGTNPYNTSGNRFNGHIDELRVVLGKAIWTEDFTPPTEPYTVKYKNLENLEF